MKVYRFLIPAVVVWITCPAQEPPTFRATTTLIEFTMVALDRKGNPVTDLKKEEISITEKGKPREIVFFRFEGGAEEAPPPKPLPPGIFTNRSEATPGPPRNVTAIVLDTLNTGPSYQAWVRAQVMRYLRTLARNTRVALYGMGKQMSILHDFTHDTDSLRSRIDKIATQLQVQNTTDVDQTVRDAEQLLEALPPEQREVMQQFLTAQIEMDMIYNESVRERRTKQTLAMLESLGNHLAGVPGRKSVVWIGGGISMLSITGAMGMGPRGGIKSYEALVGKTSERLAHQGITLYIVDARGLQGPDDASAAIALPSRSGRPSVFERQKQAATLSGDPLPAMYKMAGVTGGRVVTNSNDPADGMKAVVADLRGAYSVGFYAASEPDNQWHGLNLKVRRPGVKVLHRKGYLSEMVAQTPQIWTIDQWGAAIHNPLGSTTVRIDARCELSTDTGIPLLSVVLNVLAEDLHFRKAGDKLAAEVEIGLAEKSPTGEFTLKRSKVTISVPEDRAKQLSHGLIRHTQTWKITPDAMTVRLVLRDNFTGRYGTLDVPVKKIPLKTASVAN